MLKRIDRVNRHVILTALFLGILALVSGCKKDDDQPDGPTEPISAPTADFTTSQSGLAITFAYDGQGGEIFEWDFGDGATSTEESPVHTYADYGVYEVALSVSNTGGSAKSNADVAVEGDDLVMIQELNFSSVEGVFYAINHQRIWSVYGEATLVRTGAALAWCKATIGYEDVGVVDFEQGEYKGNLNRDNENVYTWFEDPDDQIGFKKGKGPTWSIEGGGSHGFINGLSNVWPFPAVNEIIADKAIDVAASYSVSHDGAIANADSIIVSIHGPNGLLVRRLVGTEIATSFSSSELSGIGKGKGQVQWAAYKVYEQVLGSKTYMVMNVAATQQAITIE
ncbi:MAG: PKD domain-containing protein [Cryomorphaceae bacterium]